MTAPTFDSITMGDDIPATLHGPVTRAMLALYAGASGDHNPIHIDTDFARRAGMPDVFAHGMLGMAWIGSLVTHWAPHAALRSIKVRFSGITYIGHEITCQGRVVGKREVDGEKRVELEVTAMNQHGEAKIVGRAVVAFPDR